MTSLVKQLGLWLLVFLAGSILSAIIGWQLFLFILILLSPFLYYLDCRTREKARLSNCLRCLEEQKVEFKFCINEKKLVEIKSIRLKISEIEKKERMDMYRLWLAFATISSVCLTSACLYIVFIPESVLPAKHFASFFAGASCLVTITSGTKFLDTFKLST